MKWRADVTYDEFKSARGARQLELQQDTERLDGAAIGVWVTAGTALAATLIYEFVLR